MAKRLSDLWAEAREEEFQAKVAAVSEAWSDDEVRVELLDHAVEMLKKAEEDGEIIPLDASDTFTLAVNVVEDFIKEAMENCDDDDDADDKKSKKSKKSKKDDDDYDDMDKQAEFDEDGELTKEAAAEYEALGEMVGELLAENGLALDDLEKVAEEDVEELGRWCAQTLVARLEDE